MPNFILIGATDLAKPEPQYGTSSRNIRSVIREKDYNLNTY